MSQVPQPPQPPKIPPVKPPQMPRAPGAPPGVGKLGGLFKRGRKDEFIEDDSPEDSQAPAADGSHPPAGGQATATPPEPAPPPVSYETWAWPSIEPKKEKSKAPMIVLLVVVLLVLAGGGFAAYKLLHKDKKAAPAHAHKTTPVAAPKKPAGSTAKTERTFATGIEDILAQSAAQRGRLVKALAATEGGCSIPIAQAKQQVAGVAAGRQSLLAKVKALSAPTAQAAKIKGLLGKALASSLAANRHYVAWVGGLAGASPCPGSTASNTEFQAAGAASAQASAAKSSFTKSFNPLASRLGQKTWSPDAI